MKFPIFLSFTLAILMAGVTWGTSVGLSPPFGGWQPDYEVQVPVVKINNTGILLADLNREFPQYFLGFSNNLVLYFELPSTMVIVTTPMPSDYWVHPDMSVFITALPPPPDVVVPEPASAVMALVGILLAAFLIIRKKKKD